VGGIAMWTKSKEREEVRPVAEEKADSRLRK